VVAVAAQRAVTPCTRRLEKEGQLAVPGLDIAITPQDVQVSWDFKGDLKLFEVRTKPSVRSCTASRSMSL
jgi:hypothetical protein